MKGWMIFENKVYGWLSPSGVVDGVPNSQAPKIESRGEFEMFIADLRAVADRVWPTGYAEDGTPLTIEAAWEDER